jgi:acetyltransferase-like isoleucine patch superfamily enzyme
VYEYLKKERLPIETFIHPTTHVEKTAVIQDGTIILVNCTIDMNTQINENVFISSNCFISHDVNIQAHTYCGPSVNLAGHSNIGECCFLGIGTTTVDGITIGNNVLSAAGSVIIQDIPENVLVAGVPAKVKKQISY